MTHPAAGYPEYPTPAHPDLEGELVLLPAPYQQARVIRTPAIPPTQ